MANSKKQQQRVMDTPMEDFERSKFPLGYKNKLTANFGKLIPTLSMEVMPADDIKLYTNFFSRWLTLEAPVFTEYNVRFNHFFVPNNQIWAGWSQFMGLGDDQAADYLLDKAESSDSMQVPHFKMTNFIKALLPKLITLESVSLGGTYDYKYPKLNLITDKFKIILTRSLFYANNGAFATRPPQYSAGIPGTNLYPGNEWNDAATTVRIQYGDMVPGWAYFIVRNDDYTKYLIDSGVAKDTSDKDFKTFISTKSGVSSWMESVRLRGAILLYEGFNKTVLADHNNEDISTATIIDLPVSAHPVTSFFYNIGDSLAGSGSPTYGDDVSFPNTDVQYLSLTESFTNATMASRKFRRNTALTLVYFDPESGFNYNSMEAALTYCMPVGYQFVTIDGDADFDSGGASNTSTRKLTFYDIINRTIGQEIVKAYFGKGTLSDYLGNNFTNKLVRQPVETASLILGYKDVAASRPLGRPSRVEDSSFSRLGTYYVPSDGIEIGIVNDTPISLLPYLAYHKCWSDLIRDPRFELRFVYSDPYKSPFLTPLVDGTYISGDVLKYKNPAEYPDYDVASDNSPVVGSDYWYWSLTDDRYNDGDRGLINNQSVFTVWYFFELITLRERRNVQDYFSLMSPNAQYGDESTVEIKKVDSEDESIVGEFSISAIRLANKLQRFMERNNVVGSDYFKQILIHFGVTPESCNHCSINYLGGDRFSPNVSPVDMVGANTEEQTTGQQSAQMYSKGDTGHIKFGAKEHGYLMQLLTIQNEFVTSDGMPKQRINKYDFALPEFADLGAEAVPLQRLVNTDGAKVGDADYNPNITFGYQPRYADMKCSLDQIHGDFKDTLSYWVSKRKFNPSLLGGQFGLGDPENIPELGKAFLYETPDYNAFTYTGDDYDHALFDLEHFIEVYRNLPMLPSPSID